MSANSVRTLTLAVTLAGLGVVMMIVGMFAFRDWPSRFGFSRTGGLIVAVMLWAPAQFLFAVAADFFCPDADPRVTGAFELLAWTVLAVTLIGALIWFFA